MRQLTLALVLLVGAGVALTACGDSEGESPAETVTAYLSALSKGDGDEACKRLTAETRRAISEPVAAKLGGRSCSDAVRGLHDRLSASQADALKRATVTRAEVNGDAATVRFRAARGLLGMARLRRLDGQWRISLLPQAR